MSRIVTGIFIIIFLCVAITFQTRAVLALDKDISAICSQIDYALENNDLNEIIQNTKKLRERWEKSRLWACVTVETDKIEEIEISLSQCEKYAELNSIDNYVGEYTMFKILISHLPGQEGFSLEELL